MLAIARDLVRRGLDDSTLEAFREARTSSWRRWMSTAFALTDEPRELAELLDHTAQIDLAFVDSTLAVISLQMQRERDELKRGTHTMRFGPSRWSSTVPRSPGIAPRPLWIWLGQRHTAAIVWGDQATRGPRPARPRGRGPCPGERSPPAFHGRRQRVDAVGLDPRLGGPRPGAARAPDRRAARGEDRHRPSRRWDRWIPRKPSGRHRDTAADGSVSPPRCALPPTTLLRLSRW